MTEEQMDAIAKKAADSAMEKAQERYLSDFKAIKEYHLEDFKALREYFDVRFEGMETRFDTLETRFDTFETRFDTLETRVDEGFALVDKRLEQVEFGLSALLQEIQEHRKRIEVLEKENKSLVEQVAALTVRISTMSAVAA